MKELSKYPIELVEEAKAFYIQDALETPHSQFRQHKLDLCKLFDVYADIMRGNITLKDFTKKHACPQNARARVFNVSMKIGIYEKLKNLPREVAN